MARAEASARARGLKLHLRYDPRQRRPVWFDVASGRVDKPALAKARVVAGRAVPLEPGATPAFAGASLCL